MSNSNNGNNIEPRKVTRHLASLQTKARTHTVVNLGYHTGIQQYGVISGGSGNKYTVQVLEDGSATCECDWAVKRADKETGEVKPSACSHTIAVFEHIALNERRVLAAYTDEEKARRQKQMTMDTQDGVVVTMRKGHYRQSNFFNLMDEQ